MKTKRGVFAAIAAFALMGVVLFSADTYADQIYIPDQALREALVNAIYDTNISR